MILPLRKWTWLMLALFFTSITYAAAIVMVDNIAPVIKLKNISVQLGANGKVSITPDQLDNGTSDNSGYYSLSFEAAAGTICATATEGNQLVLTAPQGTVISEIVFASYGTPNGSCGNFSLGGCHATSSKQIVEGLALGKNSVTISATNGVFGDPCVGTYKRLYVQARYRVESNKIDFSCSDIGSRNVTVYATDINGNTSSATATVTVEDKTAPVLSIPSNINASTGLSNEFLVVAERGGHVSYVSPSGVRTRFAGLASADGIVFENETSAFVSVFANTNPTLFRVNFKTGAVTPVANLGGVTQGMVLDGFGNIYATNEGLRKIQKVNPNTGTVTDVVTGLSYPIDVMFENSNTLLISEFSLGQIVRYNLATGTKTIVSTGHGAPTDIFRESENTIVVAEYGSGNVTRVNLTTGAKTIVANVGGGPHGIVRDDAGNLYVTQYNIGKVAKITPTGQTSTFSTGFANPVFLSVNPKGGAYATVNLGTATAVDNCSAVTITNDAPGTTFPAGTTTVTWTATDAAGNKSTATQTVTVADTEAPVLGILPDITVNTDADKCGANGLTLENPSAQDNVGVVSITNDAPEILPVGTTTVTYTAKDAAGNVATTARKVTVEDKTAPVITRQASNLTVECDGAGNTQELEAWLKGLGAIPDPGCAPTSNFYWSNPPVASGNKATGTINGVGYTYTSSVPVSTTSYLFGHSNIPASYKVPNQHSIKNVYKSKNTLVFDKPVYNPVLVFASIGQPNLSVPIEFSSPITVLWSREVVINSATKITGNEGYAVIRLNGVFSSISFDYLADENYVNFAFGADFQTLCATGGATATDNCSPVTWSNNFTGMTGNSVTVEFTAKDAQNNAASTSATFTIVDTKAPVITCPADITLNATSAEGAVVNYATPTGTDNCAAATTTRTAGLASGSTFPVGTTTVTHEVTDASGNKAQCSFNVTVIGIAPETVCPGTITVNSAAGQCGANVNFAATDQKGTPASTITYSHAPGSFFPVGTTAVTATATNAVGTSVCTFNVVVEDKTAPYLPGGNVGSIKADYYSGTNFNALRYSETVTEIGKNWGNGSPNTAVLGNDYYSIRYTSQFTAPATGTYTFRSLTDDGVRLYVNNQLIINKWSIYPPTSHSGTITLTAGQTVPVRMDYFENNGGAVAYLYYTTPGASEKLFKTEAASCKSVTLTLDSNGKANLTVDQVDGGYLDNCGIASRTLSKSIFTGQDLGANQVVLTVTDVNGNSSSCTVNVTVVDNIKPEFTSVQQNEVIALDETCNAKLKDYASVATATDNSGFVSITQSPAPGTVIVKDLATTVTLTAADASGNKATQTFTVTATDQTAPIAKAKNITVQLDANGKANITAAQINDGSTDNCGIATVEINKASFDCSNVGANTVTMTVTDNSGNVSTITAVVTVEDTMAPIAKAKNITVQLDANGKAAITPAMVDNGSSDNCAIANMSLSKASFDCSNVGANGVTLTVTDSNGNISTVDAVVTVEDNIAPKALTKNITVQLDAAGYAAITPAMVDNGSYDNCGIKSITLDKSEFGCANVGANTVTMTVTDNNGNVSTTTATVTVEDKVAPVVKVKDITVTLAKGVATISTNMIDNGSFDACGIAEMALDKTSFDCSNLGLNTVTLTVTDKNGNVSTATAKVNVVGTIPTPAIAVTPSSKVYTGASNTTIFLGYGSQSVTLTASGAVSYEWASVNGLSTTTGASTVFAPTVAGIYFIKVTGTNEYGCTADAVVTINVIDARCGNKNDKVLVCHKGKMICIAPSAVQAHLAQGNSIGACNTNVANATNTTSGVSLAEENELVAFPNPFNNRTNIEFSMKQAGKYRLELYDMKGALISVVAEGQGEENSYHSYEIGGKLAEGVYVARLVTAAGVQNTKIVKSK